jgi:5-methylcytosine-specific restriction endonuclease McrA
VPSGHCRSCLRERKRRIRARRQPPKWLADRGLGFIWQARKSLRGRPGERPSLEALVALWDRQQGKCALTGLPLRGTPHLDHRLPYFLSGSHIIDNLQWTDRTANIAKNSLSAKAFREWVLAAADSIRAAGLA